MGQLFRHQGMGHIIGNCIQGVRIAASRRRLVATGTFGHGGSCFRVHKLGIKSPGPAFGACGPRIRTIMIIGGDCFGGTGRFVDGRR